MTGRRRYIKPMIINTDFIRIRVQMSLGRIRGHNRAGLLRMVMIGDAVKTLTNKTTDTSP